MKSEISAGNVVEVTLNEPDSVFLGIVLDVNNTIAWKDDTWYKVQPLSRQEMPGNHWYRENKVEKVAEEAQFLLIDGGKDD